MAYTATWSTGNPIVVTGTVTMEDIYYEAYTNDWVDASGDGIVESSVEGEYFLRASLEIGDGSTPTTLVSLNESVYFDDGAFPSCKANATTTLGELVSGYMSKGSYWVVNDTSGGDLYLCNGGTFNIYGSKIHNAGASELWFYSGTVDIRNSLLSGTENDGSNSNKKFLFNSVLTQLDLSDVIFSGAFAVSILKVPNSATDIKFYNNNRGFTTFETSSITDVEFRNNTKNIYTSGAVTASVINPSGATLSSSNVQNGDNESAVIQEQYTFNLTVGDKDGTLTGMTATVLLEGSDSGTASTEYDYVAINNVTTTNGVLAEQTITAKKWVGTSETLTNYNYFRLTVSATGYETLVLENITIDSPINWKLELQDELSDETVAEAIWTYGNRTLTA